MKKIILLFIVVSFASCSNKKPITGIFVQDKLNEFIANNPNWLEDKNTEAETTERFKHSVINWSNEADFLKNIPFKLKSIKDTLINEQPTKMAFFYASIYEKPSLTNQPEDFTLLLVNGIVSDNKINNLVVDNKYTLTGNLYKPGKRADVRFFHTIKHKTYFLGKYTFVITGIKPL